MKNGLVNYNKSTEELSICRSSGKITAISTLGKRTFLFAKLDNAPIKTSEQWI